MDRQHFFSGTLELFNGEATGRLDIMGGIADYSGSLLLQMPIQEKTVVYLSPSSDSSITLYSTSAEEIGQSKHICLSLKDLSEDNIEIPEWTKYVIGAWPILLEKKQISLGGAKIWIESNVPIGKGVSSSASLEIATLRAIAKWKGIQWENQYEIAILAQKIENEFVGAPCGLMDQLTVCLGKPNKILPLICQPCEVFPTIEIPGHLYFIGIDSGSRHEVSASSYSDVRTAAFMGYSIIADIEKGHSNLQDNKNQSFGGYLANITPELYLRKYDNKLPKQLKGSEFLRQFGSTIDTATKVDKETVYEIKEPTKHPIFENGRIVEFLDLLKSFTEESSGQLCRQMGRLMYQSHDGYSKCGLGNEYTDWIMNKAKTLGSENNIFGARITGGGSGGTVCLLVLGPKGIKSAIKIHEEAERSFKKNLSLFMPF